MAGRLPSFFEHWPATVGECRVELSSSASTPFSHATVWGRCGACSVTDVSIALTSLILTLTALCYFYRSEMQAVFKSGHIRSQKRQSRNFRGPHHARSVFFMTVLHHRPPSFPLASDSLLFLLCHPGLQSWSSVEGVRSEVNRDISEGIKAH